MIRYKKIGSDEWLEYPDYAHLYTYKDGDCFFFIGVKEKILLKLI